MTRAEGGAAPLSWRARLRSGVRWLLLPRNRAALTSVLLILLPIGWMSWHMGSEALTDLVVYLKPGHRCCLQWVQYLRNEGFHVKVVELEDLESIRNNWGVPAELRACHTAITAHVGHYAIEGHVPALAIRTLLNKGYRLRGLAVAGMPAGAPGLEAESREPYEVIAFDGHGHSVPFDNSFEIPH